LAAGDRAFTTSLCYAKITPAALHCGNFIHRCRDDAEAAGGKPEFELSDSSRITAGAAPPVVQTPWMVRS
jgi:hypothetical protein